MKKHIGIKQKAHQYNKSKEIIVSVYSMIKRSTMIKGFRMTDVLYGVNNTEV